jgi:hypothetical protein
MSTHPKRLALVLELWDTGDPITPEGHMASTHLQLGLITTLSLALGYTLSSSTAIGYPAGAAVSLGTNPIMSIAGLLEADERLTAATAPADQTLVITDVVLSAGDSQSSCLAHVRVELNTPTETVGSFGIGIARDGYGTSNYQTQLSTQLSSGISVPPGESLEISSNIVYEDCSGSGPEVYYTLSGYYAAP